MSQLDQEISELEQQGMVHINLGTARREVQQSKHLSVFQDAQSFQISLSHRWCQALAGVGSVRPEKSGQVWRPNSRLLDFA